MWDDLVRELFRPAHGLLVDAHESKTLRSFDDVRLKG